MKKQFNGFQSFLNSHINNFIQYKRSLGNKYINEERALQLFDRFIFETGIQDIDLINTDLLSKFLFFRKRNKPRSYNHLRGVIIRFFKWLKIQCIFTAELPMTPKRRDISQRIPFIFDDFQAKQLLAKTTCLPDNPRALNRAEIYLLIFALLYNLGLRVGEVSRLCIKDIDMDRKLLIIRHTKFNKSRYVPFGPKLDQRIQKFLDWRLNHIHSEECPLFTFDGNRPINPCTISLTFHHLIRKRSANPIF